MKKLLITLITLMAQFVAAGDASFFKSLGFSQDGKYYAFTQDGVQDGSGFYWVELGIIDVASNKYVARATAMQDEELVDFELTAEDQKKMLQGLQAKLNLNNYGFTGSAIENVLISRPHTDLSQHTNTIFSIDYWAQGGASASVPTYELLLKEVDAPKNVNNDWCYEWYEQSKMIDLRMKFTPTWSDEQEKTYVLQVDKHQPKVRACSYDYSIAYVLNSKDSLAVVISYREPGFEGPNERYMVITNKL